MAFCAAAALQELCAGSRLTRGFCYNRCLTLFLIPYKTRLSHFGTVRGISSKALHQQSLCSSTEMAVR